MFYHKPTDTYITEGVPFTLGDLQYPANWLNHASVEDKETLELVEVSTSGERADERYFWVSEDLVNGVRVITNTPKDPSTTMPLRVAEYTKVLEAHYDSKAQERRYDSRYTCALRAGYAGPFQAEGTAFAQWMDACNAQCYAMLDSVAGGAPMPTITEVLQALPELTWP